LRRRPQSRIRSRTWQHYASNANPIGGNPQPRTGDCACLTSLPVSPGPCWRAAATTSQGFKVCSLRFTKRTDALPLRHPKLANPFGLGKRATMAPRMASRDLPLTMKAMHGRALHGGTTPPSRGAQRSAVKLRQRPAMLRRCAVVSWGRPDCRRPPIDPHRSPRGKDIESIAARWVHLADENRAHQLMIGSVEKTRGRAQAITP
jgi:hypothetical protein